MAFRILASGVIEADTAAEVVALFAEGLNFSPGPRLLTGAVVDDVAAGASRRADTPPISPRAPRRPVLGKRYRDDVLRFLAGGPKRPSEIAADLRVDAHFTRRVLQGLLDEGVVAVSGATMSRRWSLTAKGRRAGAATK